MASGSDKPERHLIDARYSHVGLVLDIKRDDINVYLLDQCCIYGINEAEHEALSRAATVLPKKYVDDAHRYVFKSSVFKAMRILGENFGYYLPTQPSFEWLEAPTGQRFTEVIALERVASVGDPKQ